MVNKTLLVGRLTKDPELRTTANNVSYCQFTLAVNRRRAAEDKQQVDFIDCVVFNTQAVNFVEFMRKGSLVHVEGRLQIEEYQNDKGENRKATKIAVDNITFLESKKDKSPQKPSLDDGIQETNISDLEADVKNLDDPY